MANSSRRRSSAIRASATRPYSQPIRAISARRRKIASRRLRIGRLAAAEFAADFPLAVGDARAGSAGNTLLMTGDVDRTSARKRCCTAGTSDPEGKNSMSCAQWIRFRCLPLGRRQRWARTRTMLGHVANQPSEFPKAPTLRAVSEQSKGRGSSLDSGNHEPPLHHSAPLRVRCAAIGRQPSKRCDGCLHQARHGAHRRLAQPRYRSSLSARNQPGALQEVSLARTFCVTATRLVT
jgi:hypothetical protein